MKLSKSDCQFLDGLLDELDDLPDGAWQAMCEDMIAGCPRFKGRDPFNVWMAWLEQREGV